MVVRGFFSFMVVGKKETQSKDGTRTFYQLAVVTEDGEASNFNCPEQVYRETKLMTRGTYVCAYDTRYQSFRIESLREIKEEKKA